MPDYPDYYLPDGPKGPSFWKQVWQIIKRDWAFILVLVVLIAGFTKFIFMYW